MDPVTTVGAGLAVIGSRDILVKILGPSADYLGGEIKSLVQKCNVNLDNIFVRAKIKLGPRIDEPGQVNPRLLRHVIDEGRLCEDSIVADYYGGVLASSKSRNERDDRGVAILSVIKDLSVYQLRLHYLFYHLVHKMFAGKGKNLGTERDQMGIYIPYSVYVHAMSFSKTENDSEISTHSVVGLARLGLIDQKYKSGSKEYIVKTFPSAEESGIIMYPTLFGAEVFVWGQGLDIRTGHILTAAPLPLLPPEIEIISGSRPLKS